MDLSSDCEKYQVQLLDVESKIKEMDTNFDEDFDNEDIFLINKYNNYDKIFFGMDITRSCESFFKPYLMGVDCQGLCESIIEILIILPDQIKRKLLKNVYLVGGGAGITGIKQRIEKVLNNKFVYLKNTKKRNSFSFNVRNPELNEIINLWKPNGVEKELRKNEKIVKVSIPENPMEMGYNGICKFIRDFDNKNLDYLMITKEEYEEHGASLFKPGVIGNI